MTFYFLNTKANQRLCLLIAVVYIWFGVLKFFMGISPAELIAVETISKLTFYLVPHFISIKLLASFELLIALLLIFTLTRRTGVLMALAHLFCTFLPILFFPDKIFTQFFCLSLLGQYIIKNIIIIGVLMQCITFKKPSSFRVLNR